MLAGWFAVWFQLFGESADRDDHEVATGAYAAGATLGVLALPALRRLGAGSRTRALIGLGTLGLAVAAGLSWRLAASAPAGAVDQGPLDGIGGVVAWPWAWVVVVLGTLALLRRGPAHRSEEPA